MRFRFSPGFANRRACRARKRPAALETSAAARDDGGVPHVWFKIDLSGTPAQFKDAVRRKDWAAARRVADKDARECGALLDNFWIQGSGTSHNGRALVHAPDGWLGSDQDRELRRRWEIDEDRAGDVEELLTVEELDSPYGSEQS
jgi:hypothetical protein